MIIDPKSSYYITEKERLLREIAEKEARLNALISSAQDTPDKLISESLSRKRKLLEKSYFAFIVSSLKENKLFGVWERCIKYFRRFRLLASILKITNYLITFISTGAFLITVLTVIIIALPFAVLAALMGVISSLGNRKRIIRHFRKESGSQSITVFSPPTAYTSTNLFFYDTVSTLADSGDTVIIVKAPNSGCKLKAKSNGVFLINQFDYFLLRKRFFTSGKEITVIHL